MSVMAGRCNIITVQPDCFCFLRAAVFLAAGRERGDFATRAVFPLLRDRRNENNTASTSTPPASAIQIAGIPQPPVRHIAVRRSKAAVSKISNAANTTTTARTRRMRMPHLVRRTPGLGQVATSIRSDEPRCFPPPALCAWRTAAQTAALITLAGTSLAGCSITKGNSSTRNVGCSIRFWYNQNANNRSEK